MRADHTTFDLARLIGLLDKGRTGEAIGIATELVRQMPGHVTGHVIRARAFESQGDFREALLSWRCALDLVPNSPVIQKGLRRTAEKLAVSDDLPAGMRKSLLADLEEFSETELPGFSSVDSMFDVEPDFERLLAEDMDADVRPTDSREPDEASGRRGANAPRISEDEGGHDLSIDAAYAAVIELEESDSLDLTTDVTRAEIEETASDELDDLIADLSTARITPADRPYPTPDLDSPIDNVATVTLANIYAEQKQYQDAARVYARLADLRPDDRDEFLRRASEMRARADGD